MSDQPTIVMPAMPPGLSSRALLTIMTEMKASDIALNTWSFVLISTDGKAELMGYQSDYKDDGTTSNCSPVLCETCGFMRCKPDSCPHNGLVAWPPDDLTRLLMEADGVTEGELEGLLKRVGQRRQGR